MRSWISSRCVCVCVFIGEKWSLNYWVDFVAPNECKRQTVRPEVFLVFFVPNGCFRFVSGEWRFCCEIR